MQKPIMSSSLNQDCNNNQSNAGSSIAHSATTVSTPPIKKTCINGKNRRRPILNRALTTSNISEKYNVVLDKRLAILEKQLASHDDIIRFQQEEQKLKLKLLHLDIEYKKNLIKSSFGLDCTKI